ncbi:hypothetical protein KUTeg_015140 [Tegillarca granosa]|uniref:Endonuclease/exonuclease/phosphatase domain-containing protein n=1 Tax=Tegillarca granosa TaxID=220873 RepID=A0ABQ9EP90_TEGGR|nr:hypothetical protein KUTeg_015140 [Tegillarca granosa]
MTRGNNSGRKKREKETSEKTEKKRTISEVSPNSSGENISPLSKMNNPNMSFLSSGVYTEALDSVNGVSSNNIIVGYSDNNMSQSGSGVQQCSPGFNTSTPAQSNMFTLPPPQSYGVIEQSLKELCVRFQRMEQVNSRMEVKLNKLDVIESKLTLMETSVKKLNEKVSFLENKMVGVNQDITLLKTKVSNLDSTAEILKSCKEKVFDLEKSIDYISKECDNMTGISDKLREMDSLKQRVIDAESRSMRQNLLFFGIREGEFSSGEASETENGITFGDFNTNSLVRNKESESENCVIAIQNFCEQKLGIVNAKDHVKIERAHRIGKKIQGKGSRYGIGEQYPKEIQQKRKELIPKMKTERDKGNTAYLSGDKLIRGAEWKLKETDFTDLIIHNDILFLSECWFQSDNVLKLPGFADPIKVERKRCKGGGLLLYIKEDLVNMINIEEILLDSAIFLKCDKSIFNGNNDLYVCFVNIPFIDNVFYRKYNIDYDDIYTQLENQLAIYKSEGHVIMMGDFNSRTGTLDDFTNFEKVSAFLHDTLQTDIDFVDKSRQSLDKVTNTMGNRLLDLCKSMDLRIMNGRLEGDIEGNYTFQNKRGISVIDYFLCSHSSLDYVGAFNIFSDHAPLLLTLASGLDKPLCTCDKTDKTNNTSFIYNWNNGNIDSITDNLVEYIDSLNKVKADIHSDRDSIDKVIEDFTDIVNNIFNSYADEL